jgi:hypothetical protein
VGLASDRPAAAPFALGRVARSAAPTSARRPDQHPGFRSAKTAMHQDNETIIKDRLYGDKSDSDVFHNEVTVIDHALTRPWRVTKNDRRELDRHPSWREVNCYEHNNHVETGKRNYWYFSLQRCFRFSRICPCPIQAN